MLLSSSALALLAAKLVVSAGIVIGVTAAAERLGPRIGGLIAATPQLSVLSLIFFTIEQGPAFAAESAFWNISGVCATIPVYLGYLAAARLVPRSRAAAVAAGVAAGTLAFVAAAVVLGALPLARAAVLPFAAVTCAISGLLIRRLPDTARLDRVPTSPLLLAARAGASGVTVLAVTSAAHLLGPKWSGLVTGFPVNSLPVLGILHLQYGLAVVKPIIRIWPAGAFGICLFNAVAALSLPHAGLVLAIALGYAVNLAYLALVQRLRGRDMRRSAPTPID